MAPIEVKPSPYIQKLIEHVAKTMDRSKTEALRSLLFRVETLARHGKLTADFGLEWVEAAALVNAQGMGAKHEDPVAASGEHVAFDISLLEKSGKSKTGFAGVHATTGNSFRALVPDPEKGGTRYLTSRPTALQAAIDRFEWFERYGIPYGNVGFHVNHFMSVRPDWSVEQTLREMIEMARSPGGVSAFKNPYTLEEAEKTLERYLKRNKPEAAKPDEPEHVEHTRGGTLAAVPAPRKPAIEVVTAEVHCAVCGETIEEGQPFGPFGKDPDDYAHTGCAS
jgi:hypothetical protein